MKSWVFLFVAFFCHFDIILRQSVNYYVAGQIADPVMPCYNRSNFPSFFKQEFISDNASLRELISKKVIGYHEYSCLTNTHVAADCHNRVFTNPNISETMEDPSFLPGTTYWFNEYLHVGHVNYDIVLIQVLQTMKVDRVVLQRAVCHGTLCAGIGSIESYYKGYFAALFEAFGQPNIPVYIRWAWPQKELKPLYFSAQSSDYFNNNLVQEKIKEIPVRKVTCFEKVIRRTSTDFGAIPTVSASAIQQFKTSAYRLIRTTQLTSYFPSFDPPYRILFAFRGPHATRRIENMDFFISHLQTAFPSPTYYLHLLNTSDPKLDFQTQLTAVASAHIVVCNHGAFEGNMIYMRNGSLLLEIFGHYGNNEIHAFHRLALMFGVYYARAHSHGLQHHLAASYNITSNETLHIINIMKDYFELKPFSHNMKGNLS
jgi:hypothetical protein